MNHPLPARRRATALLVVLASLTGACHEAPAPAAGAAPGGPAPRAGTEAGRAVLYYRNPMGLADTSPVPKQDAMGMDYVPVYADEAPAPGQVRISGDKLQKLGVRTEPATRRALARTLRLAGTLEPDERRLYTVSARFEGWVTALRVGTTGAPVRRGQPLLEVYSPEVASAQEDYRVAVRAATALQQADAEARGGADTLVQTSLARLRNWGVGEPELAALRAGTAPAGSLVLRALHDGIVLEKAARTGMRFMPGDALFQIADLGSVWLVGSVFEQDLALVHVGQHATVRLAAYPERTFGGTVTFVAPVLQPETRTVQVRIELPNPAGLLKPAMYGSVDLAAGAAEPRLAVPDSAILDTGTRRLVIVDRGGGAFEPRPVETGAQGDGYTEIVAGLAEHEPVVVNGNFLIDAESSLKAAIGGLSGRPAAGAGH